MIAHRCRRCGSTHLRKNDRTASGQQKFHCKVGNFYGTLDTKDQERASGAQRSKNCNVNVCPVRDCWHRRDKPQHGRDDFQKSTDPIGETIRPLVERPIPLYLWVRFE